jgi:Na+/proline symporter
MSGTEALSDFGLMSFTALSQLAPAVLLAVYRPRTPSPAIIAGIVLGSLVWLWLVLLPMVLPAPLASAGPDGLHWLAMFSLRMQPGHIAISMGASLAVNLVTVVLVSRAVRPSVPRQRDAVAAASLRKTAGRFLGQERARRADAGRRPGDCHRARTDRRGRCRHGAAAGGGGTRWWRSAAGRCYPRGR